jgi:hypothetical protein
VADWAMGAPRGRGERTGEEVRGGLRGPGSRDRRPRPRVEQSRNVARISEFLGIVISMYYNDHAPPHFHARYAEHEAQVEIARPGGAFRSRASQVSSESLDGGYPHGTS